MKKVIWPEAKITSSKPGGTYGSFSELMAKSNKMRLEQQKAQELLQKAFPGMLKLLEIKLSNNEPLTVMRPLQYQTSKLSKSDDGMDDLDRAFYNTSKRKDSEDVGKFTDVMITIKPGTQLMLKGIDVPMREFLFEDSNGKKHDINFDDRNKLMTQTDIYETILKLMNTEV